MLLVSHCGLPCGARGLSQDRKNKMSGPFQRHPSVNLNSPCSRSRPETVCRLLLTLTGRNDIYHSAKDCCERKEPIHIAVLGNPLIFLLALGIKTLRRCRNDEVLNPPYTTSP